MHRCCETYCGPLCACIRYQYSVILAAGIAGTLQRSGHCRVTQVFCSYALKRRRRCLHCSLVLCVTSLPCDSDISQVFACTLLPLLSSLLPFLNLGSEQPGPLQHVYLSDCATAFRGRMFTAPQRAPAGCQCRCHETDVREDRSIVCAYCVTALCSSFYRMALSLHAKCVRYTGKQRT